MGSGKGQNKRVQKQVDDNKSISNSIVSEFNNEGKIINQSKHKKILEETGERWASAVTSFGSAYDSLGVNWDVAGIDVFGIKEYYLNKEGELGKEEVEYIYTELARDILDGKWLHLIENSSKESTEVYNEVFNLIDPTLLNIKINVSEDGNDTFYLIYDGEEVSKHYPNDSANNSLYIGQAAGRNIIMLLINAIGKNNYNY